MFGDDRHLGDVAPVRRDESAALPEVEPQDFEEIAFGRRRAHEKAERSSRRITPPVAGVHWNEVGDPTRREIVTRQRGGLGSGKPRRTIEKRRIERVALAG
ncbi:hypothetical protein D3C83_31890 [compost metagenome]